MEGLEEREIVKTGDSGMMIKHAKGCYLKRGENYLRNPIVSKMRKKKNNLN